MKQLGLFAKYWQRGSVKTRLAASIGADSACEVYRHFLFHLLARHQSTGDFRTVVFSPRQSESKFQKTLPTNWTLSPQVDGDLGNRMSSYFESRFKEMKGSGNQGNTSKNIPSTGEQQNCHDKIVVIGADCPLLDVALVNSAFDQLDEAPVVLGPSLDGGYYLIAMREKCWGIFDNIHWSTANVLSQTIERLERQRIQFKLLQPLNDIDELDDLIELKIQLDAPAIQLDTLDQKLLHHIDQALSNSNQ